MNDIELLKGALTDAKTNTSKTLAHQVRMYQALADIALEELDRRGLCLHFEDLQPVPKVPDIGRIMRGAEGAAT